MYKNLTLISISLFVLYFSIRDFTYMFLSIPMFLSLSYHLCDLFLNFLNSKEEKKKKEKNFEFILMIGVVSFFFVTRDFEQTIGGYELFWKLSFLSLIIDLFFIFVLNKYYNFQNEKRFENILSINICLFLLVPNIGIFTNKHISSEKEIKQTIKINYKDKNKNSRGNGFHYNIFIKTEYDKNERLYINKKFYESISHNQNVILTLQKGILGYNYVRKIEK